ncbi:hypothetical protein [Culicoidibacter larvae]|uniref:Uncharacterized protein n=1 Tax=Culicoidibacter larvae TaxID=2579976 RepID=A0A5R8QEU6_9FIRM|nr:hypothetical protein [Culicoidibacter larvae]TLG76549.1 hypothetical protein FEZ08_02730 [Culicoidibacter larvae]
MEAEKLFYPEPQQWGLRGDPYLWRQLYMFFAEQGVPEYLAEFLEALFDAAEMLIGEPLHTGVNVHVADFSHGGMSSGQVCGDFWILKGLPLLLARYDEENLKSVHS